jgi:cell division protease FtsH
MDESVDLDAMALASVGLVGSDLANIINEAAILAVKDKRKFVNQKDLFEAFELVAVGGKEKKDRAMSEKERRIVSYHEVGHALVSALQKDSEPVQKITIVPRTMGALGYTLQTPEEEKFLETKDELLAKIVTFMGGRAAEDIKFGSYTSGAANDIEQATKIARAMVTRFGMSEKFGMMGLATVESQYLDGRASLICGDNTAGQIDEEVLKMITDAYAKAKQLLEENMESLDKISEYLFEHETITGKEFMKIFREIKGLPDPDEEKEKEKSEEAENSSEAPAEDTNVNIFEDDESKDEHDSIFDE